MPGTVAAPLGAPTGTRPSGLGVIADTLHRVPGHAVAASWSAFPAALANPSMPSIPNVKVLARRDAAIVYVPPVAGAADYRAYVFDPAKVTFTGAQPRGAVIACAGYRQRFLRNVDATLSGDPRMAPARNRELLQAIEVPGLVAHGHYQVIVEALATPCPFTGVMAHTNATIPLFNGGTFDFRSFADVRTLYGNEILNGQGSAVNDYTAVGNLHPPAGWPIAPAEPVGRPVPPTSASAPADPVVLARSAIAITRPAADEAINAPVIDVGPNATFDDFGTDGIMTTLRRETRPEGAGLVSGGAFGDWFFWTFAIQPARTASGAIETGNNPKGVQVWRRHGRLYNTFGDWGQEIFASMYFSSLRTLPQELDTSRYVHSFFRVDSGATQRRYWHWMMCGAGTREELVDTATKIPLNRPVGQNFFQDPGGANPSAPKLGETRRPHHSKECLNLIQLGESARRPANAGPGWFDESHSSLHAFVNPAGSDSGVINLKADGYNDGDTTAQGGMPWRLNASRQPTQPMFEPFDQQAPLTHFDVFVRPDRVLLYVNGRQAWCADLSARPLTMRYGHIAYGNVLYHTSAELQTNYIGLEQYVGAAGGSFHYAMNTPWSDTRVWDAVGHAEKLDIPPQFTFDPAACFKPKSTAVR